MPIVKKTSVGITPNQTRISKSKSSAVDRIENITFEEEGIKILLYGTSGSGKTTLWATFPKPILAILCSGGMRPGELRSINTPEYRKSVKQLVLHKSTEVLEVSDYIKENKNAFATVVLDHVSGLQDLVLKEILGLSDTPVAKTWGLASQQEYGQCTVQCKEYLRSLLDLVGNVVIIAQERIFKDESGGEMIKPTIGASLTPALAGWLNSSVDYVCQTYIRQKEIIKTSIVKKGKKEVTVERRVPVAGQVEYCLRTYPDPMYASKFRVPKGFPLPPVIVDPDYDKIHKTLNGLD